MPSIFVFAGGIRGAWQVSSISALAGEALEPVERIGVSAGDIAPDVGLPSWQLRGFVSNVRYAKRDEVDALGAIQPGLARPRATCAALIPIRKSPRWWALAQDERRAIFEESSRHTAIGMRYLPAIARRLHHCRDLGEPFDFLTWFEYAPQDSGAFDHLVNALRSTPEWDYVEREVDIRLTREATV